MKKAKVRTIPGAVMNSLTRLFRGGNMKNVIKLKNDEYRRKRGGTAELLDIYCSSCNYYVMLYQKDGPGRLQRCYLNRIFSPPDLAQLQNMNFSSQSDISNLVCNQCDSLIGIPMTYIDDRLAFRLVHGSFIKKRSNVRYK